MKWDTYLTKAHAVRPYIFVHEGRGGKVQGDFIKQAERKGRFGGRGRFRDRGGSWM